jgi:hypothetical protein
LKTKQKSQQFSSFNLQSEICNQQLPFQFPLVGAA